MTEANKLLIAVRIINFPSSIVVRTINISLFLVAINIAILHSRYKFNHLRIHPVHRRKCSPFRNGSGVFS